MTEHSGIHGSTAMTGRPHDWLADRCKRCGMHAEWPGAKHPCEGVATRLEVHVTQKASRDKRNRERHQRIYASPELREVRREYQRELKRAAKAGA